MDFFSALNTSESPPLSWGGGGHHKNAIDVVQAVSFFF